MSEALEQSGLREGYKEVQFGPKKLVVPSDWSTERFGDVFDRRRESIDDIEGENIKYVGLKHLDSGQLTINGYDEDGRERSSSRVFREGDVLFGKLRPNLNKAAIAPFFAVCSSDIIPIYAEKDGRQQYLPYLMHSKLVRDRVVSTMEGTNLPRTSWGDLEKTLIPLPPLPEQRRIADILSTVDEQIQQTNEIIEETKQLKRGLMQDLLTKGVGHNNYEERYLGPRKLEIPQTWKKARLEAVSKIITRGKQPTYVEEGGVPVLNQSCIYWDGFHPEELKQLDSEVADDWKDKYWVKEGDVLINSTGKGTLGRALEWTKDSDTHALDSHITRVHPDESVLDPTYFRFYLESNHGQKMLYAFCVAGSTGQIELSKTDLQTMPILLPPVEEQREISEAFHRVNKKLQDEQETKEELQELKRGLMQDLLTGKVRIDTD